MIICYPFLIIIRYFDGWMDGWVEGWIDEWIDG
jgi:hypothetical protein